MSIGKKNRVWDTSYACSSKNHLENLEMDRRKTINKDILQKIVVPKWCPTFQNHAVRRSDEK